MRIVYVRFKFAGGTVVADVEWMDGGSYKLFGF